MTKQKELLFADFPPVSTEEWMDKIAADLKGAPFEKLVWKTNEGFNVKPFYRQEDIENIASKDSFPGEFPYVRGTKTNNEWLVRQEIAVSDAAEANAKALSLLYKGVDSLLFNIASKNIKADFISALLKGIDAEEVELNFSTCLSSSAELLKILTELFKQQNLQLDKCRGSVNFDAFKKPLVKGKKFDNWATVASNVLSASKELPLFRCLMVNAFNYNNAGAYISQELGFSLACGNQYLESLTEAGFDASEVAKAIKFNFGISSNYFMEIAKFRAARMLWAKIANEYGASKEAAKMQTHAITSTWNTSTFDSHVNMLRTQTEAMSATIGGVDSLTVLPFNSSYKRADDFSERIARNQQLLLKEESNFNKIVDPSAGSYYIENLTAAIAQEAWNIFLDTMDKGGFFQAIMDESIQHAIKASAQKRAAAVASRREILLGTNQYPNFNEFAAGKIEEAACDCGCSEGNEIQKLDFTRGASEFEALRLATEKAAKRPKVFMLTIGNLAMRLARAQFSSNFFACAGYEIIDNLGFNTVEEGVAAAQKVGASIIVLCSSDDEYAELAPTAFKAIKGKQLFVVAGAPACMDELKAQGIEYFVNVKSNVLETLKRFNHLLNNN